MPPRHAPFRPLAAAGAAALVTAMLAGCGTPPWEDPAAAAELPILGFVEPTEASAPELTPTETATPTPGAAIPPFPNDLAAGSSTRQLAVGAMTLVVNYWSDLALTEWTPTAVKPLTVSVTGISADTATLSSVQVRAEALTAEGWQALPDGTVTAPVIIGEPPVITPPLSTTLSILLGAVPSESVAVRLTIVYTIGEDNYYGAVQHSATDSVTVAVAS